MSPQQMIETEGWSFGDWIQANTRAITIGAASSPEATISLIRSPARARRTALETVSIASSWPMNLLAISTQPAARPSCKSYLTCITLEKQFWW